MLSGVPRLIDPEDMMIEPKPDQFSVMTYLSLILYLFLIISINSLSPSLLINFDLLSYVSQLYHVFEKNANPGTYFLQSTNFLVNTLLPSFSVKIHLIFKISFCQNLLDHSFSINYIHVIITRSIRFRLSWNNSCW